MTGERRLASAIETIEGAALRIRSSLKSDRDLLETVGQDGADPHDEDRMRATDAFVQRYQQFYEHFVRRLYPALYRVQQIGEPAPLLIDLIAHFEQVGLVEDAAQWVNRAELRNRLIHEYPLEKRERAETIQNALREAEAMLTEMDRALDYVAKRNLSGADR